MPKSRLLSTTGENHRPALIVPSSVSWNHCSPQHTQTVQPPIFHRIFLRGFFLSSVCHLATYLCIFSRAPNLLYHRSNRSYWTGIPLIFHHQTCQRSSLQTHPPPFFQSQWETSDLPSTWAQNQKIGLVKISPSLSGIFDSLGCWLLPKCF